MAHLLLSKATLSAERKQLAAYRRFLPSLEMKRLQLMATVKHYQQALAESQQQQQAIQQRVIHDYPMVANDRIELRQLVQINAVDTRRKNIAGVWIEELATVHFHLAPLSILTRPHWVDGVQRLLQQALQLKIQQRQQRKILQQLEQELLKVTQRVNLFDKVLIPQALANIRKIQIFLDDKDREAVITSKIAKNKRAQSSRKNDRNDEAGQLQRGGV